MCAERALDQALLAEVAAKADLIWVQVESQPPRGMWHVWHDGAVTVVTDGLEQPDPGFVDGGTATLILRSKDKQTRVLTIRATVRKLVPSSAEWDEAAKALHPKRLNPVDGEAQPERWRGSSTLWELRADGDADEGPGRMSDAPHRAEPVPTEGTTSMRRPFHAGKATKRRK
jgi:hypothetical protein